MIAIFIGCILALCALILLALPSMLKRDNE
jgi:hypothetical protein